MTPLFGRICSRMWQDRRFRSLPAPAPNARLLHLYLLTGPHRRALPGLFSAGRAGLAESLAWDLGAFLQCFGELERAGFVKADWSAPLVWLPEAMADNAPTSPKTIQLWREVYDELPDCRLRSEALLAADKFMATFKAKKLTRGAHRDLRAIFHEIFADAIADAKRVANPDCQPSLPTTVAKTASSSATITSTITSTSTNKIKSTNGSGVGALKLTDDRDYGPAGEQAIDD